GLQPRRHPLRHQGQPRPLSHRRRRRRPPGRERELQAAAAGAVGEAAQGQGIMAQGAGRPWRLWRFVPTAALGGAVVLMVAGLGAGLYGEQLYRAQKIREVTVQAEILAATVTAAVAFDDAPAAQEYVNALRANPEMEAAGVYDGTGRLIAGYQRAGVPLPQTQRSAPGPFFEDGHLVVTRPVEEGGTRIGTVQMRTLTEPVARRFTRYGAATLLVGMAALLLAVLGAAQAALTRANRELRRQADELSQANDELR